jgi:hypothetical protein
MIPGQYLFKLHRCNVACGLNFVCCFFSQIQINCVCWCQCLNAAFSVEETFHFSSPLIPTLLLIGVLGSSS